MKLGAFIGGASAVFGCVVAQACATPATVPAVTALVVCIVDRADVDANAQPPMTDTAIVEDVAGYCSSDIPTVIATLAARKADKAKAAKK